MQAQFTGDYTTEYQEFDGGEIVLPVRVPLYECPLCGLHVPEHQMLNDLTMCGDCEYDQMREDQR